VLLATGVRNRLLVGWAVGTITSIAGIIGSYAWDLPTGATVVCAFGAAALLCALLRLASRRERGVPLPWGSDPLAGGAISLFSASLLQ
jgi:zinc/manganese transport system permease protein